MKLDHMTAEESEIRAQARLRRAHDRLARAVYRRLNLNPADIEEAARLDDLEREAQDRRDELARSIVERLNAR